MHGKLKQDTSIFIKILSVHTQSGKTSARYSPMDVLNNQNDEFIF